VDEEVFPVAVVATVVAVAVVVMQVFDEKSPSKNYLQPFKKTLQLQM